jgi:hypothetical protein
MLAYKKKLLEIESAFMAERAELLAAAKKASFLMFIRICSPPLPLSSSHPIPLLHLPSHRTSSGRSRWSIDGGWSRGRWRDAWTAWTCTRTSSSGCAWPTARSSCPSRSPSRLKSRCLAPQAPSVFLRIFLLSRSPSRLLSSDLQVHPALMLVLGAAGPTAPSDLFTKRREARVQPPG